MSVIKDDNNEFLLTDEKMDFLIKEAVRIELERQKVVGLELETVDESKLVNVYA